MPCIPGERRITADHSTLFAAARRSFEHRLLRISVTRFLTQWIPFLPKCAFHVGTSFLRSERPSRNSDDVSSGHVLSISVDGPTFPCALYNLRCRLGNRDISMCSKQSLRKSCDSWRTERFRVNSIRCIKGKSSSNTGRWSYSEVIRRLKPQQT